MDIFSSELNEQQRMAATHDGSPLLVLAGAGSGKTKLLVYRALYLVNYCRVRPEEIILLTFTNKAAEEMKSRISRLGNFDSSLGFAGTFHTFCARFLRIYGHNVDLPNNFVIYDADDSESAYKLAVKRLGLDPKSNKPGMFMHIISRMKNDLITKEDLQTTTNDEFYKKLISVWTSYENILAEAKAIDFDDLLIKTVSLLRLPIMQEKLRGKYNFILVDEYQDTNKAQFELTKLLATNPNGLLVVGDASQAIYSFRGADFRNINLLSKEYPDLTTLELPINYRSTQTILDAAYGVIANNTNHPILKLQAEKELGEKIEFLETNDEREEAVYVVSVANKLIPKGMTLGVLYRTNAQSRAIEEALIRAAIDYRLVGGIRFYDRAEIKDLLAYLRIIYNPEDVVCDERIEKLGKRNKAKFDEWRVGKSGLLVMTPKELLEEIMEQTGYMSRFDDRDEADVVRVENIKELLAVSSEFEKLEEFLESVALIQSDELADRKSGAVSVTMMTIHAAKGLEFDEVIIVGLEEGLLPHSRSLMKKEDIEEERRLMYVAMTRARNKLHLSLTRSRLVYGGRQSSLPSRFLSEIPELLIKANFNRYESRPTERTISKSGKRDDYDNRRIVPDWETDGVRAIKPDRKKVEAELVDDFNDIDSW